MRATMPAVIAAGLVALAAILVIARGITAPHFEIVTATEPVDLHEDPGSRWILGQLAPGDEVWVERQGSFPDRWKFVTTSDFAVHPRTGRVTNRAGWVRGSLLTPRSDSPPAPGPPR